MVPPRLPSATAIKPSHVTLRQLRAFLAVARTGSFTLAAESLYITQSALSGLVKDLEASLGARLVDRSTRRVHLTAIGESLQPRLDAVIDDLDAVLGNVASHQHLQAGVVRIATSQLLAATLLPELIAAYQAAIPSITIQLIDTPVAAVMARVFAGEADLGIGPEREPNSDITSSRLFEGPFAASLVDGYGLRMTPLTSPEIRRGFDVFTRRGRSLSPAARSFLDFIGPRIRALPYLR